MSSDERLWGLPKEIGEASTSSSPIVELERRASRLTRLLDAIRAVSDEGAQSHGPSFFRTFTRRLCEVLDTEYAFVGRLEQRGQVQTLALFAEGAHRTDFVYKLEGTPCANPASGHACAYADKVVDDFPSDRLLADLGIRGYAGIRLRVATGMTIGILVVLSKKPIDDPDFVISVLLFFATRAALELQETHVAEQLRERDLALRCLMDSNIVGFATLGADGQIRDANGAFLSVLRLSRAKVEEGSARWERHILPERQDALASLDAAPLCETELVRDDSTRVSVILGAARDPSDGRVTVLVLDQTERVRAERERQGLLAREQAALAEAQQASCAKDRFLAVLSHELRNPLAPIASGVQLLQRMVTDPRARGPLTILERNVRREARLVDDLLDLSRITRGMLAVVREPILLNRPLEDTLAAEIDDFARAGIKLESVLEPELWAEADPGRVSQILLNLLSNARKLTPRGGWVRVTLMRAGTCARLIVEDGGKGIAPEVLPLLFTPFSKSSADGGTSAGLGIGLSIVRALAELHGGRTWAESDGLGRGSRFFVEFPLRALLAAPSFERSATLGKGKLLLVEDNADAREITAMSLTDMGFSVQAFDCAEAALEALASFEPDLMIADIGLPGMDGCALLVRARRLPHLRGLPALAATAYGRPEDARRIRQAGFDGHFVKPFDLKELAERINELIAEKHALSPAPTSLP